MSGLNVEHIWHKFGDRMLLRDIALQLQAGECCCLLGKSDSGKSINTAAFKKVLLVISGVLAAGAADTVKQRTGNNKKTVAVTMKNI